uniref:Uncharacterized protein n=1 Tax=Peronospora matthiolae TaxID=2874970 RepID=A0AAV1V5I5_9STRA
MKILVPAIALALVATLSSTAAQRFCGQNDQKALPPYTVYNNLWGQANDPKGTQCTEATRVSDNAIAFTTKFTWTGGQYQVKSFANAALTFAPVKMSQVKSMPTEVQYEFKETDNSLITNFAYDMFLRPDPQANNKYEVMVWLATFGNAAPLADKYPAKPIKENVKVGGVTFNLYKGMNGKVTVFTFLATVNTNRFKGDLRNFFTQLPDPKLLDDQYLVKAETGTEPFQGHAEMVVSKYSLEIIS